MRRWTFVVAVLVFFVAAQVAMARGVALRFNFEKGKPLRYSLTLKSHASFSTPDGKQQKMKMSNYLEISQELIERKKDGNFRLALTIDKAKQIVNGKEQPLPPNIVGQTQLITMKPTGELADAITTAQAMGGTNFQMVFPERRLNEGDKWKQSQSIEHPIPMDLKTVYRLAKIKTTYPGYPNPTVLIKSRMAMQNKPNEDKKSVVSQTHGNLWFDAKAGRIVRSKAISEFQLNVPVQIPGLLPPDSTVKIKVKLQIEIRLMR